MKRTIFTLCLVLCFSSLALCQSISRSVIATAGGDFSNSSVGYISWTMGELATEYIENTLTLSQGFQQGSLLDMDTSNEPHISSVEVSIYPNPCEEYLSIEFKDYIMADYRLFNQEGQQITQGELLSQKTIVNVSALATGSYTLVILKNGFVPHLEKIIKTK